MNPVLWHNGSDITYIPSLSLFIVLLVAINSLGFLGGSVVKESSCDARDLTERAVLIPGLGRSPGEGNHNPLQYSCLENPVDRGAWWAPVHGVTKSQTRLSN